ncbi:hypothetical protein [Thiolapillus sp.]
MGSLPRHLLQRLLQRLHLHLHLLQRLLQRLHLHLLQRLHLRSRTQF